MLTKFDATNPRGNTFSLEMLEGESAYQIVDIEGLEPVKAELVSSSYAGRDGEQFQSARRGPRDIKFKMDFDPDFEEDSTVTALRQNLYRYFLPKRPVDLRFYTSTGLYVDIKGVVESFDTPIFSEDPDVTINVRCFEPDFIDPRMVVLNSASVNDSEVTTIVYPGPGTVETGVVVTMHINRTVSDFSIYNLAEDGVLQQLNFSGSLIAGDELVVSSLSGSKGITLTRAGISSSYLYGRTAQSGWINFLEGNNDFRVYAEGDPIPYTLEYKVRYGGL